MEWDESHINTAEISAQQKFIFVILVAIYPFINEIVEMPEKHLGKIHDPIFLLKKSGLYLWYCVSVQAKIVADSAQTANNMWQLTNFRDNTFDLLCCQFYIIQAVHCSFYGLQPTFHFILNYFCKMCFLPLEAPFSNNEIRQKCQIPLPYLPYIFMSIKNAVDATVKMSQYA
jgi:hypothetical protein